MRPRHAAIISLILALAVGAGAYAAQRTTAVAASKQSATGAAKDVPAQIASRTRALDRMEASLRKALRQKPPALPKVPHYKPVKVPKVVSAPVPATRSAPVQTATAPPAPATPRIVTVRPPPHIVIVHRHGGEHEGDDGEDGARSALAAGGQSAHQGGGYDD